eukprot:2391205-Amphidinium_carterae.1
MSRQSQETRHRDLYRIRSYLRTSQNILAALGTEWVPCATSILAQSGCSAQRKRDQDTILQSHPSKWEEICHVPFSKRHMAKLNRFAGCCFPSGGCGVAVLQAKRCETPLLANPQNS